MNDRVLITGGTGFLGSALAKKLVELNFDVILFDNNVRGSLDKIKNIYDKVTFVDGDIRNIDDVKKVSSNIDTIFHLAFINGTKYFYEKPELVLDVGVKGALNILDFAGQSKANTFIMASSSEVYNAPTTIPTLENERAIVTDIKNPRFSYAGGKLISELLTVNYFRKTTIRDMIFRPHNIFGPDMGNEHVIPDLVKKIVISSDNLRKIECTIDIQGSGKETRAFCYIDDAVDQLICMMNYGKKGELYNIGMQKEIDIKQLVADISSILKVKTVIEPSEVLMGSTSRRCPNTSKIKSLGYKEINNYHVGLEKTINWYIENLK